MCLFRGGSLSLSQKPGPWGIRNSLLASSLYYPTMVPASVPESTVWVETGDKNSVFFLSPLALLKKQDIKNTPSDGSHKGWSRVLSPFEPRHLPPVPHLPLSSPQPLSHLPAHEKSKEKGE